MKKLKIKMKAKIIKLKSKFEIVFYSENKTNKITNNFKFHSH